jgi:hypothetical protein
VTCPTCRPFTTLTEAIQRRHVIVVLTALISLWSAIYSPLGGAYFNIAPIALEEQVAVVRSSAMPWSLGTEYGTIIATDALGVCRHNLRFWLVVLTRA